MNGAGLVFFHTQHEVNDKKDKKECRGSKGELAQQIHLKCEIERYEKGNADNQVKNCCHGWVRQYSAGKRDGLL